MKPRVGRVAWYRFHATLRRRAFGLVSLVVLIAMLGGLAMAALAGARRNQSAYPAFLASTNPSDLVLPTGIYAPQLGFKNGYQPGIIARIARLPGVRNVESALQVNNTLVDAAGRPLKTPPNFNVGTVASLSGYHLDEDRIKILRGRMLDPAARTRWSCRPTSRRRSRPTGFRSAARFASTSRRTCRIPSPRTRSSRTRTRG